MEGIYYFAFGMNMLEQNMKLQMPDAEFVGVARLEGVRLVFRKTVSVIPAAGFSVPVAVWRIGDEGSDALRLMDVLECSPKRSTRTDATARMDADGSLVGGVIYTPCLNPPRMPGKYYVRHMRECCAALGLDDAYIDEALAYTEAEIAAGNN